jgi:hypothetical protein
MFLYLAFVLLSLRIPRPRFRRGERVRLLTESGSIARVLTVIHRGTVPPYPQYDVRTSRGAIMRLEEHLISKYHDQLR